MIEMRERLRRILDCVHPDVDDLARLANDALNALDDCRSERKLLGGRCDDERDEVKRLGELLIETGPYIQTAALAYALEQCTGWKEKTARARQLFTEIQLIEDPHGLEEEDLEALLKARDRQGVLDSERPDGYTSEQTD